MLRLAEFRAKGRELADYLTWAAMIAPGVVLNKDGSLQRTLRYRGPDFESLGAEELIALHARVNNALMRFGSGWVTWFEADRRASTDYPASDFPDGASWLVDEERRHAFEEGGRHFETDHYLTLQWLPPADREARTETWLIEDPADAPRAFGSTNLQQFLSETGRAFDLLSDIFADAGWLNDDETLTYLHACISTKRHTVRAPQVPMYLDALLADTPLVGGVTPMLGDEAVRIVSAEGFPAASEPQLLAGLDQLGFAFRRVSRVLWMGREEAERELKARQRNWLLKRKSLFIVLREALANEPSQIVNADADNKSAEAGAVLEAMGAGHISCGYVTIALVVRDKDVRLANEKARAIERVFNTQGFVARTETLNAVDAWFGTLPGNAYAHARTRLVQSLNIAHLAPLSSVWSGPEHNKHLGGAPLILARSANGAPFRLTTHEGDVGHAMVIGPTGSGKSVLLSLMALQFRRYPGAQIFAFDKGASARCAMLAMGGAAYDLAPGSALAFQPLARIDEAAEIAFAQNWVLGLLEGDGVAITPPVREAVWSALGNLASAPKHQRTLTSLIALLQPLVLREALRPWTLDGPWGAFLDADHETFNASGLAVFEMEALLATPKLAAPVLTYLFHRLEERFDGTPTLLILDEAWAFLDHPLFSVRLREWLKTLRKKNVSVVFATQSLADLTASKVSAALIENCPSRLFLANPRASEPGQGAAYRSFGLSARQIELISRATPKRDYYMQSPSGCRLFDLDLGPVALAFCAAGTKDDLAAIDRVRLSGGNFAARWLRHRGEAWAADLIDAEFAEGALSCAAE